MLFDARDFCTFDIDREARACFRRPTNSSSSATKDSDIGVTGGNFPEIHPRQLGSGTHLCSDRNGTNAELEVYLCRLSFGLVILGRPWLCNWSGIPNRALLR
eukprot:857142_1